MSCSSMHVATDKSIPQSDPATVSELCLDGSLIYISTSKARS